MSTDRDAARIFQSAALYFRFFFAEPVPDALFRTYALHMRPAQSNDSLAAVGARMRVGATVFGGTRTPQVGVSAPTPAPAVMLHRLSGPLNALLACGFARLASGGVIDLFPNASEANDGGMVAIAMSVVVHCPLCSGYADSAANCSRCGGRRTVQELFSAWLAIPPGIADGTILYPSAVLPGMVQPVSFRVRR